ncbi:class I SAM-dependent methyltransferase [Burkholderia ambifaria]|uniref:class I SAM-dependent methyltransferase n=1 Tax=Burkholderia ambifaria TaxID=152480 RepID=UPI002FE28B75
MNDAILTSALLETRLFDAPEPRRIFDIERVAYLLAAYESAKFFSSNMRMAKNLVNPAALLKYALAEREIDGLVLEFGVATGATLNIICQEVTHTVFGFDSFNGLPEDWTHFQRAGRFSRSGMPPENIPENSQLVIGLFSDVLPSFLSSHHEPVSFVHIDCDLYTSTKTVLESLAPRLRAGSIIVFDEYFNYPGWQENEHKAFCEYLQKTGMACEYIGFASSGQSVAVRLK